MTNLLKIGDTYFNMNNVVWIEDAQETALAIDGNETLQKVVRVYFNTGGDWETNPNSISFRGQEADMLIEYLNRIAVDVPFLTAKD